MMVLYWKPFGSFHMCFGVWHTKTKITAIEKESLEWKPRRVIKRCLFFSFYTFFVLKSECNTFTIFPSDFNYVSSGACSVYLHNAVDFPHKEEAGKESHSTWTTQELRSANILPTVYCLIKNWVGGGGRGRVAIVMSTL